MEFYNSKFVPVEHFRVSKVFECLTPSIVKYLKDHYCYLCGGAFISLYLNTPINDLDIYIPSDLDTHDLFSLIKSLGFEERNCTKNASTFFISQGLQRKVHQLQIITKPTFRIENNNIERLLSTFDFIPCMIAYDFHSETYTYNSKVLDNLLNKRLTYNVKAQNSKFVAYRLQKYLRKGFSISNAALYPIYFRLLEDLMKEIVITPKTLKYITDLIEYGSNSSPVYAEHIDPDKMY